ncbi:hypothetical protein [Aquimarina sp. 2201CG5-10]|uniref:hypothetical protein n=1 Tax=Aquimarina callyspongiae TaxID=3098150 RepID=UPI002AB38BB6|nr:hypothetical protein [Aquimarina sp. 2201CG5-10]MDY8137270.1 hypothetical protein [Aquimarina sp. 2201CG5-10]
MIRILFDEIGSSNNDIFLKVDAMPSFLQVADTYYLGDFLIKEFETKKELVLGYLDYFKEKIQGLNDKQAFIAFDLSDQYVGGLFISKVKKGLIKVEYGWTKEIAGWEVGQESISNQVKENRKDFKINRAWLLSKDAVIEGLNWSIEKIKKLPATKPKLH